MVIEDFKHYRVKQVKPITVNGDLKVLRVLFNVAVKWRKIGKNPVDTVKPINIKKTDQNRVRFFSEEELKIIFKAAEQPYKDVFKTLLYTGMRRNELRFLTVEDIDFGKNLIYITHTADFKPKSESRSIPIHSAIRLMHRYTT